MINLKKIILITSVFAFFPCVAAAKPGDYGKPIRFVCNELAANSEYLMTISDFFKTSHFDNEDRFDGYAYVTKSQNGDEIEAKNKLINWRPGVYLIDKKIKLEEVTLRGWSVKQLKNGKWVSVGKCSYMRYDDE